MINRLNPRVRDQLTQKLVDLATSSNLRGTQLAAFCGALSASLHCTQGPPGTGKSYLGVILIRALDMIRDSAKSAGLNLGPVLILSYKNHALDEILLDVIATKMCTYRGALVRCGKAEDAALADYSEWRSREEKMAQEELHKRVSRMRAVRGFTKDLRSLISTLEDDSGASLEFWTPAKKAGARGVNAATAWIIGILVLVREFEAFVQDEILEPSLCYALLGKSLDPTLEVDEIREAILTEILDSLMKNMEHWKADGNRSRVSFLLFRWLCGSNPPPRCAAWKNDGCVMVVENENEYCNDIHACLFPGDQKCPLKRDPEVMFCASHRCEFVHEEPDRAMERCFHPKRLDSIVCDRHVCRWCVELNFMPARPKQQRGTSCQEHSCGVMGCGNAMLGVNVAFCRNHACNLCFWLLNIGHPEVKVAARVKGSKYCAAHVCGFKDCRFQVLRDGHVQKYCGRHVCRACEGTRNVITVANTPAQLCEDHRCKHEYAFESSTYRCDSNILPESIFCEHHTCRLCVQERQVLDRPIVDDFPRNVCERHPLCTFQDNRAELCNELATEKAEVMCRKHALPSRSWAPMMEKVQCSGITSKRKLCKTKGFADRLSYYCPAHADQRPDSIQSMSDDSGSSVDEFEDALGEVRVVDERDHMEIENMFDEMEGIVSAHKEDPDPVQVDEDDAGEEVPSGLKGSSNEQGAASTTLASNVVDNEPPESSSIEEDDNRSNNADSANSNEKSESEESLDSAGDCERIAFGAQGDELDLESESEGIPENLEHLRDIVGNEFVVSGSESDTDAEDVLLPSASNFEEKCVPKFWVWPESRAERLRKVRGFLCNALDIINRLALSAEKYVEDARRDAQESAAIGFKRARVVGATVVGATRRLQALRACEPFAMIVEEACEVMETTLLSVLSVRSLRKLELIGDHRQLPAFVQPCWFAIQTTHPSIKVSLFERLVESKSSTLTVLDEQRRMRPEICDLTRVEYSDSVEIQDHDCTRSQLVADRVIKANTAWLNAKKNIVEKQRELWAENGKVIPGVQSQVYFWDIESKESRAHVGLSRCNVTEAESIVGLTKWLLECGVPPSCITIITPFKGQKVSIIRNMRNAKVVELQNVLVSTVDRYQGDENDIIILSITSTQTGNRFVALRNRFIVACSRARLGFFVLGSSSAIGKRAGGGSGPTHWCRLLEELKTSPHPNGIPRIGKFLPLCCPRHPDVKAYVKDANGFPSLGSFCNEPCPYVLPWCGHSCGMPCHNPKVQDHSKNCSELVERLCPDHKDVPLRCQTVKAATETSSLKEAIQEYLCEVPVTYRRHECSHSVDLPCHQYRKVVLGTAELKPCEEIVGDYVNPSCGHVHKNPKCHRRRHWEQVAAPKCMRSVSLIRDCGCEVAMSCHEKVAEMKMECPPPCKEAVAKPRPRCSHLLSSRCFEATELSRLWEDQPDESVAENGVVRFGVSYGPSETILGVAIESKVRCNPTCSMETRYQRECGHVMKAQCAKAFQMAVGVVHEPVCIAECTLSSPRCGHEVTLQCNLKSRLESKPESLFSRRNMSESTVHVAEEETIRAAPDPDKLLNKVTRRCQKQVQISKSCGHLSKPIPCTSVLNILRKKEMPRCDSIVDVKRECGHVCNIPCFKRGLPFPDCREPVDERFVFPNCPSGHSVLPSTCIELQSLRTQENPECSVKVRCRRARCSHEVNVECRLRESVTSRGVGSTLDENSVVVSGKDYLPAEANVPNCTELVTFEFECGHRIHDVPCFQAFQWAEGRNVPLCHAKVELDSPLCGHIVSVECYKAGQVEEARIWNGEVPGRITKVCGDSGEDESMPIVVQGQHEIGETGILSNIVCHKKSLVRKPCGHDVEALCRDLTIALSSRCEVVESRECERCNGVIKGRCFQFTSTAPPPCSNEIERTCDICGVNKVTVKCGDAVVRCGRDVQTELGCGHTITWKCGVEENPSDDGGQGCIRCLWESWLATANAVNENTFQFDYAAVESKLRSRVREILNQLDVIEVREVNLKEDGSKKLIQEYGALLKRHADLLRHAILNDDLEGTISVNPPFLDDESTFKLIYKVARNSKETSLTAWNTCYGRGVKAKVLDPVAINEEHEKCDKGTVRLIIGATLYLRCKEGCSPFWEPNQVFKKKKKKNRNKQQGDPIANGIKIANSSKKKIHDQGYDCVAVEGSGGNEFVFWGVHGVITLFDVHVRLRRDCAICMEAFPMAKGWMCNGEDEQFLCRDCFSMLVDQAAKPDAVASVVNAKGEPLCPGCKAPYDVLSLMKQQTDADDVEEELYEKMENLRRARYAEKEAEKAVAEHDAKLKAELERILQIKNAEEREAEMLRLKIIDEILTLKCPGCSMAFVDFQGCFALMCTRAGCGTKFCAWCLKVPDLSHGNLHNHIINCTEASHRGDYYYSLEIFQEFHRQRQKREVVRLLREKNLETRNFVLAKLRTDRSDLGISTRDLES